MILYLADALGAFAVVVFAGMLFLTLTRPSSPLCVRRRLAEEPRLPEGFVPPSAALKPPEPKAPRDTSRPYPRPKGSRSKLNRVCPVCGTGSETGDLDGRVLGWPAHASCAEWLGDWESPKPAPPPFKPDKELIGHIEQGQKQAADPGPIPVGPVWCQNGTTDPVVLMTQHGMISLNEARERLNREIVASWGVPSAWLEKHTHKAGDPVPTEQCPKCGARFYGTPDYLRSAYKMHLQVGCRQSSSSSRPSSSAT